jgi:hypothetical protein
VFFNGSSSKGPSLERGKSLSGRQGFFWMNLQLIFFFTLFLNFVKSMQKTQKEMKLVLEASMKWRLDVGIML